MKIQEEKAMQAAPVAPIDASKFVAYVTERRKKRILFKGEYLMVLRSIDPLKCQCNVASSMAERNQYSDTLPYDHARVVLSRKPNDENSHYINASYVSSWLREKAYVVTQSVKSKAACAEFWRMVWELRSNTIVMLTKVFDFMRVMCIQYWPITTFRFGEIEVETLETKTYAHFVIRTLKLRHANDPNGEERIVRHFHFTEWELNSFPYISAFIELRRRVRQWTDKNITNAPIVVHCRFVIFICITGKNGPLYI
uniref:Protein tyrosine phosphatase n=1 Tax=Panagrolaimus sp. JU765 TaxID=591449 RepID=A0AC34Q151_9BILA